MLKDWLVVNEVVDGALVLVRCKPAAGHFKCNIDRPFARVEVELALECAFETSNWCLLRWQKLIVLITPICEVHVSEALGLLSAPKWVHKFNLGPIEFELDS
ncbi:hypothetical protein QL285_030209 [Trifolium repens]|jgi:hypothetical protein|nr:hypothetical protein QL285_030209 [Trifolium repens]